MRYLQIVVFVVSIRIFNFYIFHTSVTAKNKQLIIYVKQLLLFRVM